MTGKSLLPDEDPDPDHFGIQKIDRRTVNELDEVSSFYSEIQRQLDEADHGLNPLGLAKGVVPFDIDPARVDAGETHFEQILDRAEQALASTVAVWDFANQLTRMLRFNQVSSRAVVDLQAEVPWRESSTRPVPVSPKSTTCCRPSNGCPTHAG